MIRGWGMTRVMVAFLLGFVAVALHAGGVYKWTDENGQLHFTDKPPIGKQAQTKDVRPASGDAPADDAGSSGLRTGELQRLNQVQQQDRIEAQEKKRAQQEYMRKTKAQEDSKRRACESARDQESYYADKLRTGCDGGSCDYYKQRREDYRHKAHDACR